MYFTLLNIFSSRITECRRQGAENYGKWWLCKATVGLSVVFQVGWVCFSFQASSSPPCMSSIWGQRLLNNSSPNPSLQLILCPNCFQKLARMPKAEVVREGKELEQQGEQVFWHSTDTNRVQESGREGLIHMPNVNKSFWPIRVVDIWYQTKSTGSSCCYTWP